MDRTMKEVLHSLVNEKVIVMETGSNGTACCILDLVLYHQLDIFSYLRTGFIHTEVDKVEFGGATPVIWLKKDRKVPRLTKKETRELLKHWN